MTTIVPNEVTSPEIAPINAVAIVTNNDQNLDLRRVLVVDDDEQNRLLMKYVLQSFGMSTLEANDGKQAVDVASSAVPDVILMDLSMPVMDGFEATRQLKQLDATKHIPVIAVSAFCDDPAKHRLVLSAGCTDCVEKPIRLDKVKAALQAV